MARIGSPKSGVAASRFGCASLGFIEVLCTISRRNAGNTVSPVITDAALKVVRQDFNAFFHVEFDDDVIRLAESLASTRRLRGADCIHLASAMHMRDALGATVILIATDAELLAAATAEGFSTLDLAFCPPLPPP